ncbi:MAG: F0F1 ATP synthase subunit gamma [Endozoicomonadaceae bacterium]|nr:F0F1 ATP synthase subunit gamma [Endozoicomonadaceae bacterium]MCY4329073.1 F0F1 ATP synthase subunit gamma [Endozoicomonadaceae bacterium]
MSQAKEIRTKISSIKSTQKITKAMEMVAASKMRKAQLAMEQSRPYADSICQVIGHLAKASSKYKHRYMVQREVKRVGFIVVSTDRGLCGGLNINLFRSVVEAMVARKDKNIDSSLCLLGNRAITFFTPLGGDILAAQPHIAEKPLINDLIGIITVMLQQFDEGAIDKLYIAYNRFENTMKQTPQIQQLLPLPPLDINMPGKYWDYIYEPDADTLLAGLLERYIETQIYQAVIDNHACEQAARMVAMKSASDNAGDLMDDLQLIYNKARQAAITQEISEIVGGASAV